MTEDTSFYNRRAVHPMVAGICHGRMLMRRRRVLAWPKRPSASAHSNIRLSVQDPRGTHSVGLDAPLPSKVLVQIEACGRMHLVTIMVGEDGELLVESDAWAKTRGGGPG